MAVAHRARPTSTMCVRYTGCFFACLLLEADTEERPAIKPIGQAAAPKINAVNHRLTILLPDKNDILNIFIALFYTVHLGSTRKRQLVYIFPL